MNDLFISFLGVFLSFSSLASQVNLASSKNLNIRFDHTFPLAKDKAPVRVESLSRGVVTSAQGVLVMDADSNRVLYSKNPDRVLSAASLTKLLSAVVLNDLTPDWDAKLTITEQDRQNGNRPNFYPGDVFTLKQLLNIGLISSDNDAIAALVRSTGLSHDEFVKKMNEKAKVLGMNDSSFFEPTGLNPASRSTARDILILLRASLKDPKIQEVTSQKSYYVQNHRGVHNIYNTDVLLNTFLNQAPYKIIGGKTGFIDESGYSLAIQIKNKDTNIVVVVLGSKTSDDRFKEIKGLVSWIFQNFQWPQVGLTGL